MDLSPAEATWSSGNTVFTYPEPETPVYADPAGMTLQELIDSQPRGLRPDREGVVRQSPFLPVNTRRHDLPTEYRKARETGYRTLSLDAPAKADAPALSEIVADDSEAVPYTVVDPTTAYRIESERAMAKNGPLLRTFMGVAPDGRAWPRTEGNPFNARVRIERLNGDLVYVFDDSRLQKHHYRKLGNALKAMLVELWGHIPSAAEQRRLRAKAWSIRTKARRDPIADALDPDPFRVRFEDEELHAPYEEPVVELTDDAALNRFGRSLDLLYDEEIAELQDEAVEAIEDEGGTVPVVRHLRGHPNWPRAAAARVHIGEYLGSEANVLG